MHFMIGYELRGNDKDPYHTVWSMKLRLRGFYYLYGLIYVSAVCLMGLSEEQKQKKEIGNIH